MSVEKEESSRGCRPTFFRVIREALSPRPAAHAAVMTQLSEEQAALTKTLLSLTDPASRGIDSATMGVVGQLRR